MLIENELSKKYVEFSHRRKKNKINKIARSDLYNCKKFQDQKHNALDQDIYIYININIFWICTHSANTAANNTELVDTGSS